MGALLPRVLLVQHQSSACSDQTNRHDSISATMFFFAVRTRSPFSAALVCRQVPEHKADRLFHLLAKRFVGSTSCAPSHTVALLHEACAAALRPFASTTVTKPSFRCLQAVLLCHSIVRSRWLAVCSVSVGFPSRMLRWQHRTMATPKRVLVLGRCAFVLRWDAACMYWERSIPIC